MGISGIGSIHTYIYNEKTGKLSSKDGTKDSFVDYFNGDLSEELTNTLNGFDANRKKDMEAMLMLFHSGLAKNVFSGSEDGEYEITSEIVDAVTSNFSVNGEKIFTAYHAVQYTDSEIKSFGTVTQPYKTYRSQKYDPLTNSINIAVGDRIDFGNGYMLTVKVDHIYAEGWENRSDEDYKKIEHLVWGLNALIHFADQQWLSSMIDADKDSTPMILELLRELGVDTSREFMVNGTKCEVRNGKIKEVGNNHVVPGTIYSAAVNRYEEMLKKPLTHRKKD